MEVRAGSRGGRVGLWGLLASSSLTALLVGSGAPAAFAACNTNYSNTTQPGCTNTAVITGIAINNSTISSSITNSGTISPNGIVLSNGSTINGAIFDAGTISGGISIDNTSKIANASFTGINVHITSTFAGGISNSGTVSATGNGIQVYYTSSFAGGISNSGNISGTNYTGILIEQSSTFAGGVVNSGTISGGRYGINIDNASTFSGGISNSGKISGGEYGIAVSGGTLFGGTSAGGGISNSGTISAAAYSGILVRALATFAGGIGNAGTISASAAEGIHVSGVAQFGSTSAGGGISNSGTILAKVGISLSNVATFVGGIGNSGTINATGLEAIDIEDGTLFHGGISNSGVLSASGSTALRVSGISTFQGGIQNSGLISGPTGIAVNTISTTFAGSISNAGTISASVGLGIRLASVAQFGSTSAGGGIVNSGAILAAGTGIYVNNVTTFLGGISNTGTIVSQHAEAIWVYGGSVFTGGISNAGTVSSNATVIGVTYVSTFAGGITNSGRIIGDGIYVYGVSTFLGGIVNTGTMSGLVGIDVYKYTSFFGGVSNAGVLESMRVSSGASNDVVTVSTFGGGITNSGTIAGPNAGIIVGGQAARSGTLVLSAFSGGISNSGTISAYSGIEVNFLAVSGSTITVSTFAGGITNSGTILASGQDGIWVGGGGTVTISTFAGNISNSGTISAGRYGIFVGGTSFFGGTVTTATLAGNIGNSGTIAANNTAIRVLGVSTFTGGISNTGTVSGATGILVSNSGALSVFDSGTIIGSGGTAVDLSGNAAGNAFTLGPGYSITGKVLGQGADTFQLGGTGTGNFNLSTIGAAQQYQGFTTFNVVSGTWTATGTFGQTQAWNVNGGTLAGTGTFAGINVNAGGTLEPGTPGAPGTFMTLNGNLAFASGAAYQVNLNSTTASRANVAGSVTLNGAVQGILAPGSYSKTTTYDILDPSSISGTFAGFTALNAPGFGGTLTYQPNDVLLNLTAQLGSGGGLSPNQLGVATAINTAFNNGAALPAGFFPVFGLSGPALGTALSQLSGESATDADKGAFQLMNEFLNLMLDPVAGGGGSVSGGGATGFAPEQETSLPADVALAYAKALKAPAPQNLPPSFDQRWTAWGSGFGGTSFTNGNPAIGSNNAKASDYGFAAGMEYHLTPDTVYGFGLAGGGTNWNLAQALGSGRSDAFQAGVYAKTHFGPLYLSGALAFANHWFTTNRIAMGDQLQASFTGQSYAARGEVGYRYAVPITGAIVGVTPYAALQAQDFHTPSYSETDLTSGGFGLSYASANATDTRSELGTRFDNLQVVDGMPLILRGRLAWAHDWYTNATALNAVFQALPSSNFTVNGAAPPKNSALTTAAAELHITSNWTAIAKFEGEFGSGSQTYGGTGTLKYSW